MHQHLFKFPPPGGVKDATTGRFFVILLTPTEWPPGYFRGIFREKGKKIFQKSKKIVAFKKKCLSLHQKQQRTGPVPGKETDNEF